MSLIRLRLARSFPLFCAVTLCAFAGCASSTVLQSQPPGARVLLNGQPVGNTPYTMTDSRIVGSSTQVRLEAPGYQPLDATISRSEELDILPLIGGIFLLVPLLWVMKYQPTHLYQLQPGGGAPAPGGYPPPPAGYPAGPAGYPPPPSGYPPAAQ
jgi:PEGA domain